jgi:hypothetical protein
LPDSNISFIFQDLIKPSVNIGGPEAKYHITTVLGTYDCDESCDWIFRVFVRVFFVFLTLSGNFATVKLCIHKETGDSFALKIIDKKRFLMSNATKRPNALMDEVNILKNLQHPNVREMLNALLFWFY